jgi:ABC-type transporter Mla subunit MlaD
MAKPPQPPPSNPPAQQTDLPKIEPNPMNPKSETQNPKLTEAESAILTIFRESVRDYMRLTDNLQRATDTINSLSKAVEDAEEKADQFQSELTALKDQLQISELGRFHKQLVELLQTIVATTASADGDDLFTCRENLTRIGKTVEEIIPRLTGR